MLVPYCTPGDGESDLPTGPGNPESPDKDDIEIQKRLKALVKTIFFFKCTWNLYYWLLLSFVKQQEHP